MARKIKPHGDFRGGWNADSAPDNLKDNELALADNADMDERGALSNRKGTVPLNATSYGAEVEQLIEWSRNDGSQIILAMVGNSLCKIAEDGTKTVIKALARNQIGYFFLQDKVYLVDGAEYYVYDGTTIAAVTPKTDATNSLTPIKRCKYLLWHPKSFRIFAAGDSSDKAALYYSEPNDPTFFKSTSKLYPTTGDGPVQMLSMLSDAVIVYYTNSDWVYKGVDPNSDAVWERLPVTQGTLASQSVVLTPSTQSFLGRGGIYTLHPGLLNGNVVLVTGEELVRNLTKDKVSSVIRSMVHVETACAVYDRFGEKLILAYGDDSGNPRNNKMLVYDWALKSFVRYDGIQVNAIIQRANGDILIGSKNYILKLGVGQKDWDVNNHTYKPIHWKVKTKQFDLDAPTHEKIIFGLFVAARQYGIEQSTVNVEISANPKTVSFQGISLDDSFVWGERWQGMWGWTDYIMKHLLVKLKGNRFQVTLENNALDEVVTIYGLSFDYMPTRAKGMKITKGGE